jgi:septum formation protein
VRCSDVTIPLILASGSPRRRELLTALGLGFQVLVADVDESRLPGEEPAAMARRLALAKAEAVSAARPSALVVAADTIVVLGDCILGKPRSPLEATAMLASLRGRMHTVLTGLAVVDEKGTPPQPSVAATNVRMREYAADEVLLYVATGDPLDKAGAYAVQHETFAPVASLDGCYANVMGLPLCHLYRALARQGITPPIEPLRGCPWAQSRGGCAWMRVILGGAEVSGLWEDL